MHGGVKHRQAPFLSTGWSSSKNAILSVNGLLHGNEDLIGVLVLVHACTKCTWANLTANYSAFQVACPFSEHSNLGLTNERTAQTEVM